MSIGTETMEKFYQAEQHNCSDFETKCLNHSNSTDEDITIFVQAGKRVQQNTKYMKLKRKDSNKHIINAENSTRFKVDKNDKFKVKTKRKRRCCPTTTIAFCFCWCLLVLITFITLLKFTKPGSFALTKGGHAHQFTDKVLPQEDKNLIRSCEDFKVATVWTSKYSGMLSESAMRTVDVNQDGTDDIIIGFTADASEMGNTTSLCSAKNETYPCGSGAMAMDGKSGKELWVHYIGQGVYGINCNGDITFDGIPDCLLGGRAGAFVAVDGRTGAKLWSFKHQPIYSDKMNLYTAQFVQDLDNDGVMEVLQTHGGDIYKEPFSKTRMAGRLVIISGKSGKVLKWMETPDKKETYFSPVVYTLRNGTDLVVFGTGGETHGGALYVIQLCHLYDGKIDLAIPLHKDNFKGIMNPPVLVDLTKDGTVDIVIAFFNSTIAAIDGENFNEIWTYSVPNSETYSIPSPGYFNNDDTIDFMIKMNIGPGYPVYYYSIVLIIDGLTGKPITNPLKSSVATFDSPLSISMEGRGNDLFLFWMGDCLFHEGHADEFAIIDSDPFDSCQLRFNTREYHKLCIANGATKGECRPILETGLRHDKKERKVRGQRHSPLASGEGSKKTKMHDHSVPFVREVIGTGTLMQSQEKRMLGNYEGIDVIVAEVWFRASGHGIKQRDMECIENYNRKHGLNFTDPIEAHRLRYNKGSPAYEHCMKRRANETSNDDVSSNSSENGRDSEEHSSKTTIRRLRLECVCSKQQKQEKCAEFLPIQMQRWAGYMGSLGNGFFNDAR